MSPRTTVEEQKGIENNLTQHLIINADRNFIVNIDPNGIKQIIMPSTMPDARRRTNIQTLGSTPSFCKGTAVEKKIENYSCIECGLSNVNDSPAIVLFNTDDQRHYLEYQDNRIDLECNNYIPFIHYDDILDMFFVGSGKSVKIVHNNSLLPFSLNVKAPPMLTSTMTSWKNKIALGNRKKVHFYDHEAIKAQNCDAAGFFTDNFPSITSIAACNDLLCTASNKSHSIHVSNGEEITSVLFGHAAAVTCLASTPQGLLLSGSADSTARLWDTRLSTQVLQLERHLGALTFISSADSGSSNIILTGGEDHYVRGWDIRADKALFEIKCGTGKPIDASLSIENKEVTVITNEETQTTASGFSIPYPNDKHRSVTNLDPNLCIKFGFK
jgi:WD40 repeat protein